jgi:outer membrane protein OmpA-like peptidoglycan-associated protein
MKRSSFKKVFWVFIVFAFVLGSQRLVLASDRETRRNAEIEETQKEFSWWPTDAKPAPVKDEKGGYWWWPTQPGQAAPLWGNRGYIFVYKIIFDYKSEELPPPQPKELRPSLIIKKIIKNVKVYFDYNKSAIREDAAQILKEAAGTMTRNPQADILVTGNCDIRGSEAYNEKLGIKRGEVVRQFMIGQGLPESRIRIISRGKLDAVAHITDLVGMQKDRNAQFMIAEVEEVMIPYEGGPSSEKVVTTQETKTEEGKIVQEKQNLESEVKVSTKEYTVKANDSLWKIAEKELGSGHRWKYLYEINKERIKNPNKLKVGTKLVIPVE